MTVTTSDRNTPEIDVDADLGYGKLWATLLRRRYWFLGILAAALSFSAIKALEQQPEYESSFQLLIESVYRSNNSGPPNNNFGELNVEIENYATQLEVMRSSQLLKKAQEALSSEYPDLKLSTIESNFEIYQVEGDDYAEDRVKTTVFEAEYSDDDPLKSKRVLEAIIQVYQNYTLEQQKERLSQGLSFIDAQLPIARKRVTQAENNLERFRKAHNLINPEQRATAVAGDLKAVKSQKRQVKVDYQNTLARYNAWQNQLKRSPDQASVAARLSQSSRYQAMLEEVQKTQLALKARETRFKSSDPVLQNLREQLKEQRSLLKAEAQTLGINSASSNLTSDNLLKEGQLGDNDLESANELAALKTQLDSLKAQEQGLAEAELQLQAELDRFPSLIAEYNRLRPEVDVRRETLHQLLSARQKLSIEIDRGGLKWQIVEPPTLGEEETPSRLAVLLMGGIVGSFLGIGAALGRELLDDTVRSPAQLEEESAQDLLGVLPELPAENIHQKNLDLLLNQSNNLDDSIEQAIYLKPLKESLNLIYQNVKMLDSADKNQSLLITSIDAGVDSLSLIIGLASSAALFNQKVLLIDTNFRFPSLHEKLAIDNNDGLSNLLMGEVMSANIQTVSLLGEQVDVLTAGSNVSEPTKLLSSPRLKELMYAFERNYDLVLLSSPPILGNIDALQTAQCCQGIVLIEKINQITKTKLSEAKDLLNQLNILGIVADGGETSEAKLRKMYEPQWQSMLKELPPADVN